MAAIEAAAIKAIAEAAATKAAEEAAKFAAGKAVSLSAGALAAAAEEAAGKVAEIAAVEIEQLIAAKAAELATPEGIKAAALKAVARTTGQLVETSALKKIKDDIKEKTGISEQEVTPSPAEEVLIRCFREADLSEKKQVIDLLKKYVDKEDLLGLLLSDTEPDVKEELKAVKEHIQKKRNKTTKKK